MLVSQIVRQVSTLAPNVIINFGFDQMLHRSSDAVLVKAMCDYGFAAGTGGTFNNCEFGIVTKPIAIGTPVLADFVNEKYMVGKTHKQCSARRVASANGDSDQIDILHFTADLKIRIPLDWQVWISVLNGAVGTNFFNLLVRLFWTLI